MATKKSIQQSIWDSVKDLLHQHDCVIVPGFGGFVCNREPSKIDQVSHIITPPSRKVVFNQNLKTNDGLLAGYLVSKQGLSYNAAIQIIEEQVQQTVAVLQEQKQLMIDLFGNFRLNADANYVFLPDKHNNYLTSSYGLGLIQASPVASRSMKVGKARVFRDIQTPQKTRTSRNVWPGVLAGVLVLLLSVNGYIFLNDHSLSDLRLSGENTMNITSWFDSLFNTDSSVKPTQPMTETAITEKEEFIPAPPVAAEDTSATAPVEKITESSDNSSLQTSVAPENKEETLDMYASLYAFASHFSATRGTIFFPQPPVEAVPVEEQPLENVITEPTNVTPVVPKAIKPAPSHLSTEGIAQGYYVIGGVFCKERNAKRFIKQLNEAGYTQAELLLNADINCKRVSYQRFKSRKEADQFCREIKNGVNPGAWVLAAE